MLTQKVQSIDEVEVGEFFYDYDGNQWMKLSEDQAALVLIPDSGANGTVH